MYMCCRRWKAGLGVRRPAKSENMPSLQKLNNRRAKITKDLEELSSGVLPPRARPLTHAYESATLDGKVIQKGSSIMWTTIVEATTTTGESNRDVKHDVLMQQTIHNSGDREGV